MTATEELRRLLDERGVKHTDFGGMTEWANENRRICRAYTRPEPLTVDVAVLAVPPEQAIAATLGAGTCRMERVEDEKRILHGWMECSECGPVYPPAAESIQDAVKFCPFCGRKVVE